MHNIYKDLEMLKVTEWEERDHAWLTVVGWIMPLLEMAMP